MTTGHSQKPTFVLECRLCKKASVVLPVERGTDGRLIRCPGCGFEAIYEEALEMAFDYSRSKQSHVEAKKAAKDLEADLAASFAKLGTNLVSDISVDLPEIQPPPRFVLRPKK